MSKKITFVEDGVCAPKGFRASGVHCGFRANQKKKDLGIIFSDVPCNAAAVFTQNKVKGAPIDVSREHIKNGKAQAIVVNSGNANTCAPNGLAIARETCKLTADALGIGETDVIVASTGVIGETPDVSLFRTGVPRAAKKLSYSGSDGIARAIMTTDRVPKQAAVSFTISGKKCVIGGIAKGSGMINPNMATLLCFITTDAAISKKMLRKAINLDVAETFNQISVDGDTSTNDTLAILANGLAGNAEIATENEDFETFCNALRKVTVTLCRGLAKDGEGATKLLECVVSGAPTKKIARLASSSVIGSDLVKSAAFGEDANWGRILCAVGYTEANFDCSNIDVHISSAAGTILVCKGSEAVKLDENKAAKILAMDEIKLTVNLHQGEAEAIAYGCDLTYGYVRINGRYRS
jgi:glutamate N-acetyltransferase/amino-acid N-acetyltransferase